MSNIQIGKDTPGGVENSTPGCASAFPWCGIPRRGFTLIEVLIYGFIFGAFLLLVTQLFLTIKASSANSLAMINLQQNFTRAFTDFNQTIRNADDVIIPSPGNVAASLTLNDGAIIYQLSDGVLQKIQDGVASDLTDRGVSISGLNFENAVEATQTAVIKINLMAESNYFLEGGQTLSEDFQTTVGLR